jgi:hypothetical protein
MMRWEWFSAASRTFRIAFGYEVGLEEVLAGTIKRPQPQGDVNNNSIVATYPAHTAAKSNLR